MTTVLAGIERRAVQPGEWFGGDCPVCGATVRIVVYISTHPNDRERPNSIMVVCSSIRNHYVSRNYANTEWDVGNERRCDLLRALIQALHDTDPNKQAYLETGRGLIE